MKVVKVRWGIFQSERLVGVLRVVSYWEGRKTPADKRPIPQHDSGTPYQFNDRPLSEYHTFMLRLDGSAMWKWSVALQPLNCL